MKSLYFRKPTLQMNIFIQDIPTGNYYVRVKTNNQNKTFKLIKAD